MKLRTKFAGVIATSALVLAMLAPQAGAVTKQAQVPADAVVVQVVDAKGKPAKETGVMIVSQSDGSVVFTGTTDASGRVAFEPAVPEEVSNTVEDRIYSAHISTNYGEIAVRSFNVPYFREDAPTGVRAARGENSSKQVKVHLTGKQNTQSVEKSAAEGSQDQVSAMATCQYVGGAYWCLQSRTVKTYSATITVVHLGNGEKGDVKYVSSSSATLDVGTKIDNGTFAVDGSVSMSAGSESEAGFPITGTCIYSGGAGYCNNAYKVNGQYDFATEKWTYSAPFYTSYMTKVVPVRYVGPGLAPVATYDSRDGKPATQVESSSQPYGSPWYLSPGVYNQNTTSMSQKIAAGFSVSTDVGSFTGSVTTNFGTTTVVKYSNPTTNTFVHYDWDRTGNYWYVTQR